MTGETVGSRVDPMTERAATGGGFTVLDGAALVIGAAVALVHLRSAVDDFDDPWDWTWGCLLFGWLTITSAGPFAYAVRRFFARPPGYPRLGDQLWALAGSPWLLAALVKTGKPSGLGMAGRPDPAYVVILALGLGVVAVVAVPVVFVRYLRGEPSRPATDCPTPWTDRIGQLLTVAWPLQCWAGMVVVG